MLDVILFLKAGVGITLLGFGLAAVYRRLWLLAAAEVLIGIGAAGDYFARLWQLRSPLVDEVILLVGIIVLNIAAQRRRPRTTLSR